MILIKWMDRKFYPKFKKNWDDILFRKNILEKTNNPELKVLLDFGAGRGHIKYLNFKGIFSKTVGVDICSSILENSFLDEAKKISNGKLPFKDNYFDIVISNNTVEHLDAPSETFLEINRVLKNEGSFFFKTPNKFHYVALISSITPIWFHKFYKKLMGTKVIDTFPTKYKANSENLVKNLARKTHFDIVSIKTVEGRPEYLRVFWIFYIFGIIYERVVNKFKFLSLAKCVLYVNLKKNKN